MVARSDIADRRKLGSDGFRFPSGRDFVSFLVAGGMPAYLFTGVLGVLEIGASEIQLCYTAQAQYGLIPF